MLDQASSRRDAPTLNREDWIEGALNQLADHGIDKVAVAPLARKLGVTKGSFYWHFKDRQDLLDAMLARWQTTDREIEAEAESGAGDPALQLRLIVELSVLHHGGRLETALRDWSRRDSAVRSAVRRVDRRRLTILRRLFGDICSEPDEVEVRAWLLYSLLTGLHLIAADPERIQRKALLSECLAVLSRPT